MDVPEVGGAGDNDGGRVIYHCPRCGTHALTHIGVTCHRHWYLSPVSRRNRLSHRHHG